MANIDLLSDTNSSTIKPWDTVVGCYSAFDRFFPSCGLFDLTEGIYSDNEELSYEQAQENQHDYLLDQAKCVKASRVLEIGSGYGTLLNQIRKRGASGIGITVSPEQVRFCTGKELDARMIDYRSIGDDWNNSFDSVIANGSMEHFVSPTDAAENKANDIYRNLFSTVHRIINPDSPSRRFVTTIIHFNRKPDNPKDLLRSPSSYKKGSDNFHYAILAQGWGGYYPDIGQLEHCAQGYFKLVEEVDGTEDYYLTSVEWLLRVQKALLSPKLFKVAFNTLPFAFKNPRQLMTLIYGCLISKSWLWQFKKPDPPTKLLRQTWEYQEQ